MRKKEGILLILVILIVVLGLTGKYSNILGIIQQNIGGPGDFSGSKVISDVVVPAANAAETSTQERKVNYEQLKALSYEQAYCYQLLNKDEKKIYVEILGALNELNGDVTLSSTDVEQVVKIHEYVCADNPELFWVNGYQVKPYEVAGETVQIKYSGLYTMNRGQRKNYQDAIAKVTDVWLEEIAQCSDEYEKIKKAYDLIISNTSYDANAEESQNIVSVFISGKSVCQGYAEAFQYLLKCSGIQSIVVSGTAFNGEKTEPHAWNLVRIGENYYQFDVTWGEPNYQADEIGTREVDWEVSYKYFGITDKEIYVNHTAEMEIPLPECNSTEYNYYVKEGYYYEELDKEQLKLQFMEAEQSGTGVAHIRCDNSLLYKEMVTYLIEDSKVFYIIKEHKEIQYSLDEDKMCIDIFWNI